MAGQQSQAMIGYGSRLYLGSNALITATFTELGEVTNISGPNYSTDSVDVTHMQSPDGFREFVCGLTDPGEVSFDFNYVPGNPTDEILDELYDIDPVSRKRSWKITFPNGGQFIFQGFMTSWERTSPTEDKMTSSITVKVTARPTREGNDSPIP